MNEKPKLKIDWCDIKAVNYACKNWHYSKSVPVGKLVKIGVWEDDKYIGCVLFGRGANPNLSKSYGLEQTQVCELVRVALRKHITPVTQIVSEALSLLKEQNPLMRLVISFADRNEGHLGIIYQAGNWIYTGEGMSTPQWLLNGRWVHQRTMGAVRPIKGCTNEKRQRLNKHRYVMPLDKKMRRKIIKLAKPYPKKETCPKGVTGSTSGFQPEGVCSSHASGLADSKTMVGTM